MSTKHKPLPRASLGLRHHSSGYSRTSSNGNVHFDEYVSLTRERLRKVHCDKPADVREQIVEGNSPFDLAPAGEIPAGESSKYKRGVLLVHGLSDSPYFMTHLGTVFQERGFRVLSVLLPGHGTQPGDLLEVRWQEWAHEVAYGIEQLATKADEIFMAGYSAGGALSVYHSLVDERVKGLFLFSPALSISRKAKLANLHKLYSWMIPAARWVDIKPDVDLYKYESFPKNAAAQMYALTGEVDALLADKQIPIPVFVAASADDTTVDVSATIRFVCRAERAMSRMVLYVSDSMTSHTMVKIAAGCNRDHKFEFVDCVLPEQRIVSSSHAAVVLPPADPHYGRYGDYAACAHYCPGDMQKYSKCTEEPETCLLGELTRENLERGVLRRLTYNPKFDELKAEMKLFIDALS